MAMKLLVGLGNPGEKYKNTRHNVGFAAIEHLASKQATTPFVDEPKFFAQMTKFEHRGEQILLQKPTTFMNDSGKAVLAAKQFYKLDNSDIWVISDDFEIAFGRVRIRRGGSSGGQNGLGSIIEMIGEDFWRIRIGIGDESIQTVGAHNFVLSKFSNSQEGALTDILTATTDHILEGIEAGIEHVSHNFL